MRMHVRHRSARRPAPTSHWVLPRDPTAWLRGDVRQTIKASSVLTEISTTLPLQTPQRSITTVKADKQ